MEEKDLKTIHFIQKITNKAMLGIFSLIGAGIVAVLGWGFAGASKAYETDKGFKEHCTQQDEWKKEIKQDKTETTNRIDKLFSDSRSMGIAVTKTSKTIDDLNVKVADSLNILQKDLQAAESRTASLDAGNKYNNEKIRSLEENNARLQKEVNEMKEQFKKILEK